jgi:hypothetical protein
MKVIGAERDSCVSYIIVKYDTSSRIRTRQECVQYPCSVVVVVVVVALWLL